MLHSKCAIYSEREGLRTSSLVHRRRTKTRITDKRRVLQGQRSRSQGHVMRLTDVGRYVKNETLLKHQKLVEIMRTSFNIILVLVYDQRVERLTI